MKKLLKNLSYLVFIFSLVLSFNIVQAQDGGDSEDDFNILIQITGTIEAIEGNDYIVVDGYGVDLPAQFDVINRFDLQVGDVVFVLGTLSTDETITAGQFNVVSGHGNADSQSQGNNGNANGQNNGNGRGNNPHRLEVSCPDNGALGDDDEASIEVVEADDEIETDDDDEGNGNGRGNGNSNGNGRGNNNGNGNSNGNGNGQGNGNTAGDDDGDANGNNGNGRGNGNAGGNGNNGNGNENANNGRGNGNGGGRANPNHPLNDILLTEFDISPETLIAWRCSGYGIAEITRALLLAEVSGTSADEILARRDAGEGWGSIMQSYDVDPQELAMGNIISNTKARNKNNDE